MPLTDGAGGPLPNGFDYSIIRRTPQLFSDAQGYQINMSVFILSVNGGDRPGVGGELGRRPDHDERAKLRRQGV